MNPFREPAVRPLIDEAPRPPPRRPRHYPIGAFMTAIQIRDYIVHRRAIPVVIAVAMLLVVALILARST